MDAGGDLAASGPGCRVQTPQGLLTLVDEAFAVSGDTDRFVEVSGVRYSHILNPATGLGITDRRLVSVRAPDATTADVLATALSVLPLHLLEALELPGDTDLSRAMEAAGATAYILFPDGRTLVIN